MKGPPRKRCFASLSRRVSEVEIRISAWPHETIAREKMCVTGSAGNRYRARYTFSLPSLRQSTLEPSSNFANATWKVRARATGGTSALELCWNFRGLHTHTHTHTHLAQYAYYKLHTSRTSHFLPLLFLPLSFFYPRTTILREEDAGSFIINEVIFFRFVHTRARLSLSNSLRFEARETKHPFDARYSQAFTVNETRRCCGRSVCVCV